MKKITFLFCTIMVLAMINPSEISAKPFWLKIKLGFFAKWSITLNGDCEDGMGICLAFGDNAAPNSNLTFLGYDDETNKFSIRISKQWSNAKLLSSGTYEIGENSPIDPKVISSISDFKNIGKMVVIKKGTYQVKDDGEYYLMMLDHQYQ